MIQRAVLLLATLLLTEVSARGEQVSIESAQWELARALRSFRDGRWADAAVQFEVAFRLDPQPRFLFSRAQAQRLAGDCKAAQATYAAYLKTGPSRRQANAARAAAKLCDEPAAPVPVSSPAPLAESR